MFESPVREPVGRNDVAPGVVAQRPGGPVRGLQGDPGREHPVLDGWRHEEGVEVEVLLAAALERERVADDGRALEELAEDEHELWIEHYRLGKR